MTIVFHIDIQWKLMEMYGGSILLSIYFFENFYSIISYWVQNSYPCLFKVLKFLNLIYDRVHKLNIEIEFLIRKYNNILL